MLICDFTLFYNTPDIKLNKTILFNSFSERDLYFTQFDSLAFTSGFNYRRDRGAVKVPNVTSSSSVGQGIGAFNGYNFGKFYDPWDKVTYFFKVTDYIYLNDSVTEMHFVIDPIITFLSPTALNAQKNLTITRQHLTKSHYELNLDYLRTNNDVIPTYTMRVWKRKKMFFSDFYVIITTSSNLEGDFGDEKKPKLPFSSGTRYDNITSPLNLYAVPISTFPTFIKGLEKFPWIAQTIQKCVMVPKNFVDNGDLIGIKPSFETSSPCYRFKEGGMSSNNNFNIQGYTFNNLLTDLGLDYQSLHMLRSNYVSIKLTDYAGNEIIYDSGMIYGLDFMTYVSVGYNNLVKVLLKGYGNKNTQSYDSNYMDSVLVLDDFDELPVFINNASLSKANTAYTRELAQSNTFKGRADRVLDSNNTVQDRLASAFSVISQISSVSDVGKLLSSDNDFHRQQQADFKQYDLAQPTITNAKYSHSTSIKTGDYGFHLIISKVSSVEWWKAWYYYARNGFEVNETCAQLSDVSSMRVVNYVQFTGSIHWKNIPPIFNNILQTLFEGGVHLYHYQPSIGINPFSYDMLLNERIK